MPMRPLPTGTVTFVFTDVVGSTRLLQERGPAYADLLAAHRDVVRGALAAHDGVEVDTQGDAFFAAFAGAADAVSAAVEIRDGLAGGPIQLRIGIHTGESLITDEGYVGLDVHRAARISSAASGGQIVVSQTTRDLLGAGIQLRDLGAHRLKDLTEAEHLYQVSDEAFPPLRTLDATNLPVATSELLGRDREVGELVQLLRGTSRAVTITGPGGTGKTRLALQVAAELVGSVADGVFWVALGALTDPDLVPSEIAQAIGAPDDLAGFLRDREMVVVLDNLEHLLAATPTVSKLLAGAPRLRILATSRAALRLTGETEYSLAPLGSADAVALLVARARAVGRDIPADRTAVAICERLDGLPLAIELAAARLRLFGPGALLERLDRTLPLLTDGARDAPERQRTLRATIGWSYDLLDAQRQRLFARVAVFAGSFPIDVAESVCETDVAELAGLVELSLLQPAVGDRLMMLETIREYALERLAESDEAARIHERHAVAFGRLAEAAYRHRLDGEAEWSARLDQDHDDLRAALDWLADTDPDAALELAGPLGWYWFSHGHIAEGDARLQAALAASGAAGPSRARALSAAGSLAARSGRVEAGRALAEDAVARWEALGDARETAAALDALGWLVFYDATDDGASLAAFEAAWSIWQELGDELGQTRALLGQCQVFVSLGQIDRAEPLSRELLGRAGDDVRTRHLAHHFLADCSLIRGDCEEAEARYRDSLRAAIELGDVIETSLEVQGLAMAKAGHGESVQAIELNAAVEALWRSLGVSFAVKFWDALLERYLGAARAALGAHADAVHARGLELPFEEAVALALGDQ
jgi:predicted ATPase/class 3 adenylate cyclase